jgi:hypothetical protein
MLTLQLCEAIRLILHGGGNDQPASPPPDDLVSGR